MLQRTHRFHGYNSLNYAYKNGRHSRNDQLSVRAARNDRRKDYRIAVVVSKKVSKSAVVRNRIRRRVYEAFRVSAAPLVVEPFDVIITVFKQEVAGVPTVKLVSILQKLCAELKITKTDTSPSHDTIEQKEK